jgi:hypothetical protein
MMTSVQATHLNINGKVYVHSIQMPQKILPQKVAKTAIMKLLLTAIMLNILSITIQFSMTKKSSLFIINCNVVKLTNNLLTTKQTITIKWFNNKLIKTLAIALRLLKFAIKKRKKIYISDFILCKSNCESNLP